MLWVVWLIRAAQRIYHTTRRLDFCSSTCNGLRSSIIAAIDRRSQSARRPNPGLGQPSIVSTQAAGFAGKANEKKSTEYQGLHRTIDGVIQPSRSGFGSCSSSTKELAEPVTKFIRDMSEGQTPTRTRFKLTSKTCPFVRRRANWVAAEQQSGMSGNVNPEPTQTTMSFQPGIYPRADQVDLMGGRPSTSHLYAGC